MKVPYKKMYRIKTPLGFTAECECGHRHKFSGNDINLKKSDATLAIFKNIYTCPNCNAQIDGMFEVHKEKKWKQLSPVGIFVSLVLLIGIGFGLFKFIDMSIIQPHKDWEEKQQIMINEQEEWENQHSNE